MLHKQLEQLEAKGQPIRVGIVGAGRMGGGVACQISTMKGMKVVALADLSRDNLVRVLRLTGAEPPRVVATEDPEVAKSAVADGRLVTTLDGRLIPQLPLDVVVEATGLPEVGARVGYEAIANRKHVVMLNVETDVLVGPLLRQLADQAGVVYTVTAGDEPGATMMLYEYLTALGFRVICAGKGPMRPIDWNMNPDTVRAEAVRLGLNPKMLASFRDGSKHNIEMAAVANATGLVPDRRGMHAPTCGWRDLPKIFSLKSQGGILDREGVVDLATPFLTETGATNWQTSVTPGVFVVYSTDHPQIRADLAYLVQGDGPNYVLYRHCHLCAIETPYSIARAFLHREPTIAPIGAPVVEVLTVAKRDLMAGDRLDGSGGYCVTGQVERFEVARAENILPLGLAYEVTMTKDAKRGQPITYDMVSLDEKCFAVQLRRLQDSIFS